MKPGRTQCFSVLELVTPWASESEPTQSYFSVGPEEFLSRASLPWGYDPLGRWEEGLAKVNTDSAKYKANTGRYKEYSPLVGCRADVLPGAIHLRSIWELTQTRGMNSDTEPGSTVWL